MDPWKHRSKGMKCGTCIWFVKKECDPQISQKDVDTSWQIGRCRRYAPTMNGFPVVFGADWCGDHRLDENKI